ncbi:MAG: NifB/NifX family molybdenum-iron cluster-binding protein, partial [Candidatus Methanomethylophilaceae archaeon]
ANAIVSLKVDAVITGGIGTHGMKILEDAGIYVSYDEEGMVEQCITDFMRRMEHKRKFENQPSQ